MIKKTFTYKKSGVNDAADKFVNFISGISTKNKGNKKNKNIGSFGSILIPIILKNQMIAVQMALVQKRTKLLTVQYY